MPRVVVMKHIRDREKTLFEEEETKMLKKLMLSTALSAAVATGAWAQSSSPMDSKPEPATQAQPAMKDFLRQDELRVVGKNPTSGSRQSSRARTSLDPTMRR